MADKRKKGKTSWREVNWPGTGKQKTRLEKLIPDRTEETRLGKREKQN